MTCTGMCRVAGRSLQTVEHAPAVEVGQVDVERDGGGADLACRWMAAAPRPTTTAL
jgi:hypothetical protein